MQFYYAGLSGKAGAGLGDPLKVNEIIYLFYVSNSTLTMEFP